MEHGTSLLITVVAAVGFGLLAQVLAHRWHLPAIVLLLAFGIILGEDVLGVVRPDELGGGLSILVKLAVSIILFEGALNLKLKSLRQSAVEVRNLVTIGVLVSWGITTLIARFVAGFDWRIAILFGALMTVTGPTVVQPLLRRISVPRQVKTILEGEAILIDPIGAILAIAVMDVLLASAAHGSSTLPEWLWAYFGRLLVGGAAGVVGALLLSRLMKSRKLIPAELSNLVALACVWVTFGVAEWLLSEAGIMSAVVMGLVVQREAIPGERQLRHFKETLTTLGISLLFILLAANLEIANLWAEGLSGLLAVLLVMLVARPISVFVSTWRTSLDWRKKTFIAWIGPRGIIAASVASIFAVTLEHSGIEGGDRLLALVFMAILLTVAIQGLSARWVARWLGLQSMQGQRVMIVGANRLGCTLARLLEAHDRPVVLLDTNRTSVELVAQKGLNALYGNALEEETLESLHAEDVSTFLALTSNSEVNVLACQLARDTFAIERAFPALGNPAKGANPKLLTQTGGRLAFGRFITPDDWEHPAQPLNEFAWTVPTGWPSKAVAEINLPVDALPVLRKRGTSMEVVHSEQVWQTGDRVVLLSKLTESEIAETLQACCG